MMPLLLIVTFYRLCILLSKPQCNSERQTVGYRNRSNIWKRVNYINYISQMRFTDVFLGHKHRIASILAILLWSFSQCQFIISTHLYKKLHSFIPLLSPALLTLSLRTFFFATSRVIRVFELQHRRACQKLCSRVASNKMSAYCRPTEVKNSPEQNNRRKKNMKCKNENNETNPKTKKT